MTAIKAEGDTSLVGVLFLAYPGASYIISYFVRNFFSSMIRQILNESKSCVRGRSDLIEGAGRTD